MAIVEAIKNLFNFSKMQSNQMQTDYHEDFMAMLEMINEYGGTSLMTPFPNMLKRELKANRVDLSKVSSNELKA
jgi:hypothetical protein